jgi:hypothetical protein
MSQSQSRLTPPPSGRAGECETPTQERRKGLTCNASRDATHTLEYAPLPKELTASYSSASPMSQNAHWKVRRTPKLAELAPR